ncbi:MAG: hybrid sensor histidine kinase/response regulator [Deltaproteobacteria bacterium]|jgi:two-component system, sensor histidine kinase and response regulator|nr:hybrid sensor histidine kinase/response regulator [Deltaproteobacteria bacterium]
MFNMNRKYRILIVDDDKIIIRLLLEVLGDDYKVETAFSGAEALKKVTSFNPDIILLDIMMPGMNGYDVCRAIRKDPGHTFIKILLLSAKSSLEERLEGYNAGANDYLTKPYQTAELQAKIQTFLQLKYSDEVNRLKDDLLMLQSHETKTPLNAIVGFAEILKQSKNLNAEEKQFIEYILTSGNELLENTKKTLLLCQLTKGIELYLSTVPVVSIIEECIQVLGGKIRDKNIQIRFDQSGSYITRLDIQLVNSAILYLLENAIQYSPEGSTIDIHFTQNETETSFVISDEGPGIQCKNINDIFNPFTKENIWAHAKGLGISLAICKNIALLHDGDIFAENLPDKGARFSFVLSRTLIETEPQKTD